MKFIIKYFDSKKKFHFNEIYKTAKYIKSLIVIFDNDFFSAISFKVEASTLFITIVIPNHSLSFIL